jgi:hypothetical protein
LRKLVYFELNFVVDVMLDGRELTLNSLRSVQWRSPIPSVIEIHLEISEMVYSHIWTDNHILYSLNAFRTEEFLKDFLYVNRILS